MALVGRTNLRVERKLDDQLRAREPRSADVALEGTISEANRLPYGLAGYAFTRSFANVPLLTQRLEVGMPWINQPATPWPEMPFGGVKDSAYGSEGGPAALEPYLVTKSVTVMAV